MKRKPLRYVEISRRNPITRIMVGAGNSCSPYPVCGDVCIIIEKAGSKNCKPKQQYDSCGYTCHVPQCEPVAKVCALEVDNDGYAIFQWPQALFSFQEGWYTGTVVNECGTCGEFPVRIGPRCNVIEVETIISGPDSACWISCDDNSCNTPICPDNNQTEKTVYTPTYEVCTTSPTQGNTNANGLFGQFLSNPNP
jgi:hypothetical protein